MRLADLTGERFGRWTVERRAANVGKRNLPAWWCRCECGTVRKVLSQTLRRGNSNSCGCLRAEKGRRHLSRWQQDRKAFAPGIGEGMLY